MRALVPPVVIEPKLLDGVVRKLRARPAEDGTRVTSNTLEQARRVLQLERTGRGPEQLPRRLVPAVIACVDGQDSGLEAAAVRLVLRAESVSWRRLWQLWTSAASHRTTIAPALAGRICSRVQARPSFRNRIARWLDCDSESVAAQQLADPVAAMAKHMEAGTIPLERLSTELEVRASQGMGLEVLERLIKSGSRAWWRSQDPERVRRWVGEHATLDAILAVADRQLTDIGEGVSGHTEIRRDRNTRDLMKFCAKQVGRPGMRAGRWDALSSRAQQILQWLNLALELEVILNEFAKTANDDRARYWRARSKLMTDARYVEHCGACLLGFGDVLAIEFGSTGNACYFYLSEGKLPPLAALPVGRRPSVGDFKRKDGLHLGRHSFTFEASLSHHSRWTGKCDDMLHELGVNW